MELRRNNLDPTASRLRIAVWAGDETGGSLSFGGARGVVLARGVLCRVCFQVGNGEYHGLDDRTDWARSNRSK
jgi:hypothetical protein